MTVSLQVDDNSFGSFQRSQADTATEFATTVCNDLRAEIINRDANKASVQMEEHIEGGGRSTGSASWTRAEGTTVESFADWVCTQLLARLLAVQEANRLQAEERRRFA